MSDVIVYHIRILMFDWNNETPQLCRFVRDFEILLASKTRLIGKSFRIQKNSCNSIIPRSRQRIAHADVGEGRVGREVYTVCRR